MVAWVKKPVPDGVSDHPAPPLGFQPLGHDNNAVDLQFAEDFKRPGLHLEPEAIGHRSSVNAAIQAARRSAEPRC